jgi:hypothetical protein
MCFVIAPDVPPPNETEFNEIAVLHLLMEVRNDCVLRLGEKRQIFENASDSDTV